MEFPQLQNLWSEVERELGDDVVFLCVNKGDTQAVVEKYWLGAGYTMRPVLQEGTEACDAFGVIGFPTNYVIGPDGAIRYCAAEWNPLAVRRALLK